MNILSKLTSWFFKPSAFAAGWSSLFFSLMLVLMVPVVFVELAMYKVIPETLATPASFIALGLFFIALVNFMFAGYRRYREVPDAVYDFYIAVISIPVLLIVIVRAYLEGSYWWLGMLAISYPSLVGMAQMLYEQYYRK